MAKHQEQHQEKKAPAAPMTWNNIQTLGDLITYFQDGFYPEQNIRGALPVLNLYLSTLKKKK